MSYEYITKFNSPNFTPGRTRKVTTVIVHWWGDPNKKYSFNGTVNWLCRKNGGSSAHYVVEARKVACLVDRKNRAWHAGFIGQKINANEYSIGIEMNPRCSAEDMNTLVELLADLYKTYGTLRLIGHMDVAPTQCPGRYYSKLSEIQAKAVALATGKPSKPSKPSKTNSDNLYRVQVGAFRNKANAEKLKNSLGRQGFKPIIKQEYGLFKVQTGAYAKLDNAKKEAKRIKDAGLDVCISGSDQKVISDKTLEMVARKVIRGDYGNGAERKRRLNAEGYSWPDVQAKVNQIL